MDRFVITVKGSNNETLYLCPREDGYSYVLKETPLGAAIWSSREEACIARDEIVGEQGTVLEAPVLNDTVVHTVSLQTLQSLAKELN